jgi:hypothetical protein
MFTERLSLAINPRGQLFKKEPLYQIVANSGNDQALDHFNLLLNQKNWAVYRVRRIYNAKAIYEQNASRKRLIGHDPAKKGTAERCVEQLSIHPTSEEAIRSLSELAIQNSVELSKAHGLWYAKVGECKTTYPTSEEFFVAAPARVETKARYGVGKFDLKWADMADLYCGHADLPLFASPDDGE